MITPRRAAGADQRRPVTRRTTRISGARTRRQTGDAIDGLGDMLVTAERQTQNDLVAPGERVAISFDPGTAHIFPA